MILIDERRAASQQQLNFLLMYNIANGEVQVRRGRVLELLGLQFSNIQNENYKDKPIRKLQGFEQGHNLKEAQLSQRGRARCFVSLNISLSHSESFEMTPVTPPPVFDSTVRAVPFGILP